MSRRPNPAGSPLVLLVNDEEWTARSLETVLRPSGYAVLLAYTGEQGLDLASKVRADCILIDYGLPDMTGAELAERLRKIPTVRESTPVLVISARALPRPERMSCLENGAWDVLKLPFDTDEFLVRLDRYLGAKRDADTALDRGHVDPLTGLYNVHGLTKRVTEILADAVRHDHPLACVALGLSARKPAAAATPESSRVAGESKVDGNGRPSEGEREQAAERIARALLAVTRVSDIVARVGDNDFVIVAPSTDEQGAERLADRLFEAFQTAPSDLGLSTVKDELSVRAGYHAMNHPAGGEVLPEDLLTRATLALRQAQSDEQGEWIRSFDFEDPN